MIVKICGVTTPAAAQAAVQAGADMVGLNFYPPSARYVEPVVAEQLSRAIRRENARIAIVGIFVNCAPHIVLGLLDQCGLDWAQLCGDEPPADLDALVGRGFKSVRNEAEANRFARREPPALLLDASIPGSYGGAGQRADWGMATALAQRHALILAGGLTPDNVAAAIAAVQPWGVDVASGVESEPGVKDGKKMAAFVQAAKGAAI